MNDWYTLAVQVSFGLFALCVWALILLDIRDDIRASRYARRVQIKWVFPPHSESKRLAAAQRLFDADVDTVYSGLDTVYSEVDHR